MEAVMMGPVPGMQAPFGHGLDGFPVQTRMFSKSIAGVPTEFSFSMYADRVLVIVTQLGCAGTILSATCDAEAPGTSAATFSINVLMGKRDEMLLQLCARQIVEAAGRVGFFRPMLICLGLKEHSMQVVKEVANTVTEHNIWSKHRVEVPLGL